MIKRKKIVFNSIVKSQFSCCPLVWMYKVHERAVRIVLHDHTSDFTTLLQRNNSECNHRNIQSILIEIFKTKNGLSPPIMRFTFK